MKRPRRPAIRNPHAKALAAPLFKRRVVKASTTYQRRPKHKKETQE